MTSEEILIKTLVEEHEMKNTEAADLMHVKPQTIRATLVRAQVKQEEMPSRQT